MAIFGTITPPSDKFSNSSGGLFMFLNAMFKVAGAAAGIFFIIKIITAGFQYLSASGDEKKTAQAFATIWQSVIGLAIVASAFVIASVIGKIIGINILNPSF